MKDCKVRAIVGQLFARTFHFRHYPPSGYSPPDKYPPGTLFPLPHSTFAKIKGNIKTENCS